MRQIFMDFGCFDRTIGRWLGIAIEKPSLTTPPGQRRGEQQRVEFRGEHCHVSALKRRQPLMWPLRITSDEGSGAGDGTTIF
jgi:hypothetical protein